MFDLPVPMPMQASGGDASRAPARRDAHGVARARRRLATAWARLDRHLVGRTRAAGPAFTRADGAAAPALARADRVPRIGTPPAASRAFRARLDARPSMARAIEAARPFRQLFPPGAPDRDGAGSRSRGAAATPRWTGRSTTAQSRIVRAVVTGLLAAGLAAGIAQACTRVLRNDDGLAVVVGRTVDRPESTEPVPPVVPRGMARDGGRAGGLEVVAVNPLRWSSRDASAVTTTSGIGAADGLNERGPGLPCWS